VKAASPLLARVAAFLVIFVVISGVIGSRIIAHGLVTKYGFQIYGGSGKSLLFGFMCLAILAYRKGFNGKLETWRVANPIWVMAVLSMGTAWYSVGKLIAGDSGPPWLLLAHISLLGTVILAAIGIFGPTNIRLLVVKYHNEVLISVGLSVLFYILLMVIYGFWGVLASLVLYSVSCLLKISGISVSVINQRTLLLSKFGITVTKYCSGIESIALFTGLYFLIGVLEWGNFNRARFFGLFLPALVVLFSFNILRVFGLILGGYYINPHIAFSLFHTYAGMLFFILYSLIFWRASYGWLLRKESN
jgi:exosortase/archaeosortase family protein